MAEPPHDRVAALDRGPEDGLLAQQAAGPSPTTAVPGPSRRRRAAAGGRPMRAPAPRPRRAALGEFPQALRQLRLRAGHDRQTVIVMRAAKRGAGGDLFERDVDPGSRRGIRPMTGQPRSSASGLRAESGIKTGTRPGARRRFPTGRADRRALARQRCLLQNDMSIGAAEAEGVDPRQGGAVVAPATARSASGTRRRKRLESRSPDWAGRSADCRGCGR